MNVNGAVSDALRKISAEVASDPEFKERSEYQDEFPGMDAHVRDEGFQPMLINIRCFDEFCCETAQQISDSVGEDPAEVVPLCRKIWGGVLLSHLSRVQSSAIGRTFDRKQVLGMPENIEIPDTIFYAITSLQPVECDNRRFYPTLELPGPHGVCMREMPWFASPAIFYARGQANAADAGASLAAEYAGVSGRADGTTVFYNMHRPLDAGLGMGDVNNCNKAGPGGWVGLDNGEMAKYQRLVGRVRHVWKSFTNGVPKVVPIKSMAAYTCAVQTKKAENGPASSVFDNTRLRSFSSPGGLTLGLAAQLRWLTDESLRLTLLRFGTDGLDGIDEKRLALINAGRSATDQLAAMPGAAQFITVLRNPRDTAREEAHMRQAVKAVTNANAGFYTHEWRFARWETGQITGYHGRLSCTLR